MISIVVQGPASGVAFAQDGAAEGGGHGNGAFARLSIVKNKAKNIKLRHPFADATVGSPEIADIVPISDRELYVVGKKEGTTNILLYDNEKRLIGAVDIEVKIDTGDLSARIGRATDDRAIEVQDVDGKLVLKGEGRDAPTIARAMDAAKGLGIDPPINALRLRSSQQVMLKVRFVEADRLAARALGVRWEAISNRVGGIVGAQASTSKFSVQSGTFGQIGGNNGSSIGGQNNLVPVLDVVSNSLTGASPVATVIAQLVNSSRGSLDVVISALEEQGVVRSLAEPNLVALSGETADFLAGGEYPIPVLQGGGLGGNGITIQYKEYGVKLRFTPTVLADGVISLRMEPEVSDLDYTNGINYLGLTIPGLIKRRAATTVELRDGQTFAIAGLIQAKSNRDLEQVPWLGSVPVLGTLFRSSNFQNQETELVALVTPHLVRPVPPGNKDPRLKTPLDTSLAGNDVDFFLGGRPEVPKSPPTYVTPTGVEQHVAGHIAPESPSAAPLPALDAVQRFMGGFWAAPPADPPQP